MTKAALSSVIGRLVSGRAGNGLPDRHLLECFIAHKDEAAFAALVERHGAMVLTVARNVLHHLADAEDVFQATFLVLARQAGSVRKQGSAGSWLHGVAYRLALKAKAAAAARHRLESRAPARAAEESPDDLTWRELNAILHEELERLPDKYRAPLVLCYLEGLTQDQAAKQLGLAKRRVRGRLERGRLLLRGRLTRRGLAPAVVLLADTCRPAGAAPPGPLVSTTARTAAAFAAGQVAGVSVQVAQLAEGVLRVMGKTQLRFATVLLLLAAGLVTAAAGVVAARGRPDTPPAAESPSPALSETSALDADAGTKPKDDTGRPIRSLSGHTDRVKSVAYSPDGMSIATASLDGTARIWDAKTGKEVRRLEFPRTKGYNGVFRIAFSPDNAFLVTLVRETTGKWAVIVWNRRTGEKVHTFPADASFAISPDGSLIACGAGRGIRLYELASGKLVREMRDKDEKQSRMVSLTFWPDGKTLVSTGPPPLPQSEDSVPELTDASNVLRVWDVATGKERPSALNGGMVGRLVGQPIARSPDGRTIVRATCYGMSLRESATGAERAKLIGHKSDVSDFTFSPDGRTLATGGHDGTVRLWDLPAGKEVGRFGTEVDPSKGGWVESVAFSPDGRTVVSGGADGTAHVWDVSRITGRRPSAERSPADFEADWKDLAGHPTKAYAALGRLVSSPEQAVSFLSKQLQVAEAPDPTRVERLIRDLDDEQFEVRERATKKLEALGDLAAPALKKALAGEPPPEAKRRLGALLGRLNEAASPEETARQIRAVEALESIGTPEARWLLDKLAAGPPETQLTQEAKASLGRLAKRATSVP